MSEVKRITVLWPVGPHGYGNYPVVLASEYDKAQSELDKERQNSVDIGAECNRLNSELSALREENERLKSESFEELYNAAIDERDAMREELANAESDNETIADHNIELQHRLTAAEQRNSELASLLREGLEEFKEGDYWIERTVALLGKEPRSGDDSAYDRAYRNGLMQGYNLALNGSEKEYQDAVARYSNPTESGASHDPS